MDSTGDFAKPEKSFHAKMAGMHMDIEQRVNLLKKMQLFRSLGEEQLAQIAGQLQELKLAAGEQLFSQGDPGDNFYLIGAGRVSVQQSVQQQVVELARLETGDYFGEEALIYQRRRSATISALEDCLCLFWDNADFSWIIQSYPEVAGTLQMMAASREELRQIRFNWLGKDEVIYLLARRHPARFWIGLLKPFSMLVVALLFLVYMGMATTPAAELFSMVIGSVLLLASVIWTGWDFIDWRNDFFIVTNQRVVWLEQILFRSASSQEAPLTSIQSMNIQTNLIGRAFDFGNLIVRTFTGSLVMTDVPNPGRMQAMIEELILRIRQKSSQANLENIRYSIRNSLGYAEEGEMMSAVPVTVPTPARESGEARPGILKTRVIEGETYTYYKHWYVLLSHTWAPLLLTVILTAGIGWLVWQGMAATASGGLPLETILPVGLLALLFPAGMVVYQYLDWRNDIYQVTKDSIIDSEKKPFGTEITKSAPLKNVLSLEHKRQGLIGLILNYGKVNIKIGDTTLTFMGVHDPAQVQQDIFYRMQKLKEAEDAAKTEEERLRMLDWLKTYHEIREEEGNPPQGPKDSG